MIRVLQGLDKLEESHTALGDVQVVVEPVDITVVTALDEFYIELLEDAEALRDALDGWIEREIAWIKAGR